MILPPATIGILGGGQLGRYFVLAARELGYRVMVLDPDPHSTAGRIADEHLLAPYDDPEALQRLALQCAAVTTEFESVPAQALRYLEQFVPVRPGAKALEICQDRSREKSFLAERGLPHTPYCAVLDREDLAQADASLFPGILKLARLGYDGKGQIHVKDRTEAVAAFANFQLQPCVLEQRLALDRELSVVLTRASAGEIRCFPVIENHHRHGILDHSTAPAPSVCESVVNRAREIACDIARGLDYVGTLSVEFFVTRGELLVNEIAPRPHNSGHFTLDACTTNQFEQQVRALCELPLGDTDATCVAVMVNLLGDLWPADGERCAGAPAWRELLSVPNLKLHLYGKDRARSGRKMGHFTVLGDEPERVRAIAMAARTAIGIRG